VLVWGRWVCGSVGGGGGRPAAQGAACSPVL